MKKFIIGIFISCAIGISALLIHPKPAACTWCPTYTCFGSCGSCACMQSGGQIGGQCVSFNHVQDYLNQGYTELK